MSPIPPMPGGIPGIPIGYYIMLGVAALDVVMVGSSSMSSASWHSGSSVFFYYGACTFYWVGVTVGMFP